MSEACLDRERILREVVSILENITGDWDIAYSGGIGPGTRLIEVLTCESIDIVQIVVALEERFDRRDMPFEMLLMIEGRYVDDLIVDEIVEFLYRHLSGAAA